MIFLSMENGKNHLSKKYFDTINPATEEKLSEVAEANAADVDKAVKAARNAYEKVLEENAGERKSKIYFSYCQDDTGKSKRIGHH